MKQIIFNTVRDLCADFLYYDRKGDEELSADRLKEAVKSGVISIDEIVFEFRTHLENDLNSGKKEVKTNAEKESRIDSSNFTREEASIYLQKKLFGLPSALQHTIFEAVYRIEHGGYDVQKVLDWYHKIEELYNSKI